MTPNSCPFCGSDSVYSHQDLPNDEPLFYVWCWTCDAQGPISLSEETAIQEWNEVSLAMQAYRRTADKYKNAFEELAK